MNCPFVYANGKKCEGHITELKIIKPHFTIHLTSDGDVESAEIWTEYHVHLRCSLNGGHHRDQDQEDDRMKVRLEDLPESILRRIELREESK